MVASALRLGTVSFNVWEPAVPCHGNLCFPRWRTISSNLNGNPWFPGWEPGVPTSGNRQFLAMVTCGSHVGNREFQPFETGTSLP